MKKFLLILVIIGLVLLAIFYVLPTLVSPVTTSTPVPTTSPVTSSVPPPNTTQGELNVYFIDVGQGDSILIDQGDTEVLIDGGGRSPGVTDFLKKYVQGPIEVVVASHPDADHIGGLIDVLRSFKVTDVWTNGESKATTTYKDFKAAIQADRATEHVARRGNTIQAGSLLFSVLNPVNTSGTVNNNSVVLRLEYGNVSFQFEGDAEKEAEASMLSAGLVSQVDILKVGHHGSRTASSTNFLAATHPEIAVYMAGIGNDYGHPHQETLVALANIGSKVNGTDINGTIVVRTDGKVYSVTTTKGN